MSAISSLQKRTMRDDSADVVKQTKRRVIDPTFIRSGYISSWASGQVTPAELHNLGEARGKLFSNILDKAEHAYGGGFIDTSSAINKELYLQGLDSMKFCSTQAINDQHNSLAILKKVYST